MNDIVNDQKGHNIVNDRFVHKPLRLTCYYLIGTRLLSLVQYLQEKGERRDQQISSK